MGNIRRRPAQKWPARSVLAQIGERAARLTLALLEAKVPPKKKSIFVEPTLVVRASSKR